MFRFQKKQNLLEAKTICLKKAEEHIGKLRILKNYYKQTVVEQREIIHRQEKLTQHLRDLIFNYEVNKTNPYMLIRAIKNELDNPLKLIEFEK